MTDQQLRDDERTPCEQWSRVMGYFRPVEYWNVGKQSEFRERKYFQEPGADDHWPDGYARRTRVVDGAREVET